MKALNKKTVFIIIMMIFSIVVKAQTTTVKHIVDRGETLSSIAKRYNTTEEKIIELNPDAVQFIYVGMELTIPVTATLPVSNNDSSQKSSVLKTSVPIQNSSETLSDSQKTNDYDKWNFVTSVSYGFPPKPEGEGISGSSFTLGMTAGANYNITKSFYVGARIGYNFANTNTLLRMGIGNYQNHIVDNSMIILPVELGYRLYFVKDKVALTPFAGLDVNYLVKCKAETGIGSNKEKKTIKPDERFGVNGRVGVKLNIYGFNLGASYVFSFDDNYGDNDGFPEISIGFEF